MSQKAATTTFAKANKLVSVKGVLQRKCACGNHTTSGGECSNCAEKKLQRKLSIGASNDPLELEADRVAEQVLANQATHSFSNISAPKIQRRAENPASQIEEVPASVERVLASSGNPLPITVRQDMEQRFGQDFSRVRMHTGSAAEQSARDVSANAYTVGNNIVFNRGKFSPETQAGKRLLAHELTHVVQQARAGAGFIQRVPRLPSEVEHSSEHGVLLAKIGTAKWKDAAEQLNSYNTDGIRAVLADLDPREIESLHLGAIANQRVGGGSHIATIAMEMSPALQAASAAILAKDINMKEVADLGSMPIGEFNNRHGFFRHRTVYKAMESLPAGTLVHLVFSEDKTIYLHRSGRTGTVSSEQAKRVQEFQPPSPIGGLVGLPAQLAGADPEVITAIQAGGDLIDTGLAGLAPRAHYKEVSQQGAGPINQPSLVQGSGGGKSPARAPGPVPKGNFVTVPVSPQVPGPSNAGPLVVRIGTAPVATPGAPKMAGSAGEVSITPPGLRLPPKDGTFKPSRPSFADWPEVTGPSANERKEPVARDQFFPGHSTLPPGTTGLDLLGQGRGVIEVRRTTNLERQKDGSKLPVTTIEYSGGHGVQQKIVGEATPKNIEANVETAVKGFFKLQEVWNSDKTQKMWVEGTGADRRGIRVKPYDKPERLTIHLILENGPVTKEVHQTADGELAKWRDHVADLPPIDIFITGK